MYAFANCSRCRIHTIFATSGWLMYYRLASNIRRGDPIYIHAPIYTRIYIHTHTLAHPHAHVYTPYLLCRSDKRAYRDSFSRCFLRARAALSSINTSIENRGAFYDILRTSVIRLDSCKCTYYTYMWYRTYSNGNSRPEEYLSSDIIYFYETWLYSIIFYLSKFVHYCCSVFANF